MCPGHMVEEWKKEILRLYPFAEAHIIEKLNQLQKFESVIRQKKASAPLFLIFGKDSCKMEYDERPYLHWNDKKNQYELNEQKLIAGGTDVRHWMLTNEFAISAWNKLFSRQFLLDNKLA